MIFVTNFGHFMNFSKGVTILIIFRIIDLFGVNYRSEENFLKDRINAYRLRVFSQKINSPEN